MTISIKQCISSRKEESESNSLRNSTVFGERLDKVVESND